MSDLGAFLRSAKQQGASDEFLVALLKEHGWPAKEVHAQLGAHYAEMTGIAIPAPPSRLETAREAAIHLLAFVTLGFWICSLGSVWFELIDRWIPDATRLAYGDASWTVRRIAWQMAWIIVAFPAFLWATRTILDDQTRNPDKAESGARRWLTNLALLIAALVFLGDLVSFLAAFLQGELTLRFVLKSALVFVLAASVFLYYSRALSLRQAMPSEWHRRFALGSLAVICFSLALGYSSFGSPGTQRLRAQDRRRVTDLHQLAQNIHFRYQAAGDLPVNWEGFSPPLPHRDPFLEQDYDYVRVSERSYRLCAVFNAPWGGDRGAAANFWAHQAGRHCYLIGPAQPPPWPNQ